MKKLLLALVLATLTTGCALFPSKFDPQEHARLVDIHVLSKDSAVCKKPEIAQAVAEIMFRDAEWVWYYGKVLPANEKMSAMEKNLMDMTKELNDRYKQSTPVSAIYCQLKFENIHKATDTIINVSARRPRI